jgi:hypothetical protein
MRASFGLLFGLLLTLLAFAAAPEDPTKVPPELAKARLDAARTTYEQKVRRIRNLGGASDPEQFYIWSGRWRDAEEAIKPGQQGLTAAAQAHLERMKTLAQLFAESAKLGQAGQEDASAAEYYRIQAEIDLARAKVR